MAKRKTKKISNELEIDFELKKCRVATSSTQMEFDFMNAENRFYAQLYKNKTKLKVDILRLIPAGNIDKSRKPITRMLLFKTERTRKAVATANRSGLNKHDVQTIAISL